MNSLYDSRCRIGGAFAIVVLTALGGCKEETGQTERDNSGPEKAMTTASAFGPESSPVEIDMSKGWCGGHGVPESVCTRCDTSLIPQFKAANDWCGQHDLPETQCILCNPEVKAKWEALKPRDPEADSPLDENSDARGTIRLERKRRLLTGSNDPLCQVELSSVRFLDGSIARKAGITTDRVQLRRISSVIECPAEVDFDQTRLARIAPRVPGAVREAAVEIGAFVEAGEVLAIIDSPALGEAKGRLLRAHSVLEFARATLEREENLRARGIGIAQSYEAARSNLASAEADFRATQEAVSFVSKAGHPAAAAPEFDEAESDLNAVERELQLLGLGDEQLAALGTEPGRALSRYELRSPVAGRVIQRRAVVGEFVEEREVLYSVADLATMWLMMDVYLHDLTLVRIGLPVLLTVDGLPGHSFEGRIAWISSAVDDHTRMVKVRANLPNDRGLLRANMFGLARIIIHDDDEVLSVPTEAVQTDGCCQLVFVKKEEDLFEPHKVLLGASAGGYVEILDGLEAGEQVVTAGSFLMKTEILKSNIGAGCCEVDPGR
jgi:cobalt-zinc-cadmium efflux system membrane fusion protein